MSLSLPEIKELLGFCKELGLQSIKAGDVEAVFIAEAAQETSPGVEPQSSTYLEELAHYSAVAQSQKK